MSRVGEVEGLSRQVCVVSMAQAPTFERVKGKADGKKINRGMYL